MSEKPCNVSEIVQYSKPPTRYALLRYALPVGCELFSQKRCVQKQIQNKLSFSKIKASLNCPG